MDAEKLFAAIDGEIKKAGANASMRRDRPYDGQPQTDEGERGRTEVKGITFRDLRDCLIRAVILSAGPADDGGLVPREKYGEAGKGERAILCENDLYGFNLDKLDPMAICQNLSCEVERIMGIFPNVKPLRKGASVVEILEECGAPIIGEPPDLREPRS